MTSLVNQIWWHILACNRNKVLNKRRRSDTVPSECVTVGNAKHNRSNVSYSTHEPKPTFAVVVLCCNSIIKHIGCAYKVVRHARRKWMACMLPIVVEAMRFCKVKLSLRMSTTYILKHCGK